MFLKFPLNKICLKFWWKIEGKGVIKVLQYYKVCDLADKYITVLCVVLWCLSNYLIITINNVKAHNF